ncbi:MAG: hypothetical protein DWQ01_07515 [Planctomycetota bacterium]|nr:MAG: hypothetical protein DWQ01_07515 [Planctomycetota bacterium]
MVDDSFYRAARRLAARRLSRDRAQFSITPTDLIHSSVEKLLKAGHDLEAMDKDEAQRMLAQSYHHILIDRARRRNSQKRGGGQESLQWVTEFEDPKLRLPMVDLLSYLEVLDRLGEHAPREAEVVKLKIYLQLTFKEIGDIVGCSEKTARSDYQAALSFMRVKLEGKSE